MADQPFLTAINGLIDKGVNAFQDFGLKVGQDNRNYNALQNVNNASMQAYLDDEQSYTPPAPSYPSNSDMQSYLDDSQQSYNSPSLFTDTADDRFRQNAENLATIAASNSNSTNRNPTYNSTGGGGGGASTYSAPQAEAAYLSQDLSQRTPSGTQYAPDMSAYNDSSLFNYTGPGGVDGYTYGQGLRTDGADYSVFGTPTGMVNPYYEGQFSDPVPTGPADSAVNMSPIVMPEGIPAIGGGSGTTFVTPRPPNSAGDLTYQQTIDEMGIFGPNNPPPSTLFPSPGGASTPANMGLTERQLAQMSPERIAMMNSIFDDQSRMQQGQIGEPQGSMMAEGSPNGRTGRGYSSESPYLDEVVTDYNSKNLTAQQKFDTLQERADQVMANLTAEELRDGLFIEPRLTKDGVMKPGIPSIFTQDKTPIESEFSLLNETLMDLHQFDPDDIYTSPSETDGFLWQDNNGNYHKQWDDMGLIDVIPGMNDPEFQNSAKEMQAISDSEKALDDKIAAQATKLRAMEAQEQQARYAEAQMQAREEVIQKNIAEARALAEEQARAAADRKDAARIPVYTAPTRTYTPPAKAYTPPSNAGTSKNYGVTGRRITGGR